MALHVTAVFPDAAAARRAVDDLLREGFAREHVSVVTNDGHRLTLASDDVKPTHAAAAGAALGAIAGGFVAIVSIGIPGGIVVAGPLAATLGGAAAGAVGGGLVGALTTLGLPDDEARSYEEHVREGGIVVGVATDDPARATTAEQLLRRAGPISGPHATGPAKVGA